MCPCDWSSDVCSSDLIGPGLGLIDHRDVNHRAHLQTRPLVQFTRRKFPCICACFRYAMRGNKSSLIKPMCVHSAYLVTWIQGLDRTPLALLVCEAFGWLARQIAILGCAAMDTHPAIWQRQLFEIVRRDAMIKTLLEVLYSTYILHMYKLASMSHSEISTGTGSGPAHPDSDTGALAPTWQFINFLPPDFR